MPPTTSPKKEAVLAIGLDKPTGEIMAAAKAKGIIVSRTYVDLLKKASGGAKPAAPKAAPPKAAAPKAAAPKAAAPKAAAPKAAAPKAAAPAAAPKRGPGRPPGSGKQAAPAAAAPKGDDADKAFRSAAARLILSQGLGRAEAVLAEVVAKVKAAVGG